MALFNKFFQSRKQKNILNGESTQRQQFSQSQTTNESIFPFSGEQVRVLLFRECDWNGRRLLFDSNAVQKVNTSSNNKTSATNNQTEQLPNSKVKQSTRTYIDICNGYGYTYDQASCETSNIGEMIFGSVAMSFKGTSLKVHWLREPNRILCSQVFSSPIFPNDKNCSRGPSSNDVKTNESRSCDVPVKQSTNSFSLSLSLCMTDKLTDTNDKSAITTNPLDVPTSLDRSNYAFSGCDSGYSGTDMWTKMSSSSYGCRSNRSSVVSMFSTDPSIVSSRKLSVDSAILVDAALNGRSSDGCLQRRIQRNMSTSFENSLSRNDFIGYFDECRINPSIASISNSMNRRHSDHCESKSNPEMIRRRKNSGKDSLKPTPIHFSSHTQRPKISHQRRPKIGLAVCIRFSESVEEEMQLFCSEHIALLESMLCRLRAAAESAFLNQKRFLELMLHAWFATTSWITDLFTAPRIQEPVWFSLSNGYSDRPNNLAKHFMTELCWLLNSADTKDTNFFVSTLLTAILTNHLGWVATVAPILNSSVCNDQVITINQNQAKMSEISKFHPYNVLWAQLGDLYGSIGNPSRLAKTIVCGAHTVTIKKILSVLTYFVRCGEIQRMKSMKQLNKTEIEELINKKDQHRNMSATTPNNTIENTAERLFKSKTCSKEMMSVDHDKTVIHLTDQVSSFGFDFRQIECEQQEIQYEHTTSNKNISNISCGVHGTQNDRHMSNNMIKLMVTSPDNDRFEYETASEAIDFTLRKIESTIDEADESSQLSECKTKPTENNKTRPRRSLWTIDTVKDGISIDKWKSLTCDEIDNGQLKNIDLRRSQSLKSKSNMAGGLRRSKTVREINANDSQNDEIHTINPSLMNFSNVKTFRDNQIESPVSQMQDMDVSDATQSSNNDYMLKPPGNVVFVLGDNEVLSGLKTPPPSPNLITASENRISPSTIMSSSDRFNSICETNQSQLHTRTASVENLLNNKSPTATLPQPQPQLQPQSQPQPQSQSQSQSKSNNNIPEVKKKHCTHKKHSGVKFNFEQYPQIVTNYMKNKNLDITNYDFLEKGLKLEQENTFNYGASSTSILPVFSPEDIRVPNEQDDENQCECCANTFRVLQTPSNATELEFSNDDAIYPVTMNKPTPNKLSPLIESNNQSIENAISNGNHLSSAYGKSIQRDDITNANVNGERNEYKNKNKNHELSNITVKKYMKLITLPIPKTEIIDDTQNRCHIRPGYVPSLFVGITDHFIPDMVIQGITAPLHTWEPILKQNLNLTSHCATFEQTPMENVAVVANVDKWDVKLISSQTYALSSNGLSGPIGMSQLVSTMLETVHAMWMAGSSAYQCISFMESKLKEIYLQSETLAAFLLATEFCSLNTVTTALNLSANDVPLLLSVASIHSPQVTKKYGISFR